MPNFAFLRPGFQMMRSHCSFFYWEDLNLIKNFLFCWEGKGLKKWWEIDRRLSVNFEIDSKFVFCDWGDFQRRPISRGEKYCALRPNLQKMQIYSFSEGGKKTRRKRRRQIKNIETLNKLIFQIFVFSSPLKKEKRENAFFWHRVSIFQLSEI